MDKNTSRIVVFSSTQVMETGNSNQMENMGFKKGLAFLKDQVIIPEQITTNRHT